MSDPDFEILVRAGLTTISYLIEFEEAPDA